VLALKKFELFLQLLSLISRFFLESPHRNLSKIMFNSYKLKKFTDFAIGVCAQTGRNTQVNVKIRIL